MKLPIAYSQVIRYGNFLPREQLTPWFEHISTENGSTNNQSSAEYPFADFLEDNNDPRSVIIKKDLATREGNTTGTAPGYFESLRRIENNLIGIRASSKAHKQIVNSTEHGQIDAGKITGPKGVGYRVHFYPPDERIPPYLGVLTPEEFTQFLSDCNSELTLKDFD